MIGKDVLHGKGKRVEYSPLGKELKKQTRVAEKQYKKFDNIYEFHRIKKEKLTIKKYNRSNLIYDSKCSLYEYYNIKEFNIMSPESKYPILLSFYNNLNKFNTLNPRKERTKEKKATVYYNASPLHNEYLEIYFNQYNDLSDARKRELGNKYDPINLFLETHNYNTWFENDESD